MLLLIIILMCIALGWAAWAGNGRRGVYIAVAILGIGLLLLCTAADKVNSTHLRAAHAGAELQEAEEMRDILVTLLGVGLGLAFGGGLGAALFRKGKSQKLNRPTEMAREFRSDSATKKCPDCAETIKLVAHVCRFCGHRFEPTEIEAAIKQGRS